MERTLLQQRSDWDALTDEVIMDFENMSTPLHVVERGLQQRGFWPREFHPNPIGFLLAQVQRQREVTKDLTRELDMQYKYIEWLEQYAPKAGEFNLAWDAYEAQMEEEE
tara:strand:- start:121 stop:447 length:327 start_codon:yes stop_codon:yes gene_type:complete